MLSARRCIRPSGTHAKFQKTGSSARKSGRATRDFDWVVPVVRAPHIAGLRAVEEWSGRVEVVRLQSGVRGHLEVRLDAVLVTSRQRARQHAEHGINESRLMHSRQCDLCKARIRVR